MIGPDAIDPGIDLSFVDDTPCGHIRPSFRDAFGFPGEAALPLCLGFRSGVGAVAPNGIDGVRD